MKHNNEKLEMQKKNYLKSLAGWTKELDEKINQLKNLISEKESLQVIDWSTISKITTIGWSVEYMSLKKVLKI